MAKSDNIPGNDSGKDEIPSIEVLIKQNIRSSLEMALNAAMAVGDTGTFCTLLREKKAVLAEFKNHEFAKLMDAAIETGSAADEFVGMLLEAGVPAHCVYDRIGTDYQHTPVITAAKRGRLDLIEKLMAAGADLFWKSPTGANVLSEILPSRTSQAPIDDTPEGVSIRDWLVARGVRFDPDCADSRRKMIWASSFPASWPDVPTLLGLGIPFSATGWSAFMFDLAMGRASAGSVEKLTPAELNHRDRWSRTPFLLAVTAGNLPIAQALLSSGSDLHARGHCGTTALHIAASHNYCDIIEWLLAGGAQLDVRNEFGGSPLHDAVTAESLEAAALFLREGADLWGSHEVSLLIHEVSYYGAFSMLKLLLGAGAKVNSVSDCGSWPLRDACEAANADAVSFLLREGADPNLTSTGETALFAAVSSDSIECVRMLLEAGADVNAQDVDGWTCLFCLRSERVADLLLNHGASPGISDQCGKLPEDWERIPLAIRCKLRNRRHPL